MKKIVTLLAKSLLKKFDIAPIRYTEYKRVLEINRQLSMIDSDVEFLLLLEKNKLEALNNLKLSKSQIRQDLFVLSELDFKKNGYFVEFGATNGVDLSNTYLLEKEFHWEGILAEPAKCWHADLLKNRKCNIEFDCVWSESGKKLEFIEVETAELSKINHIEYTDANTKNREQNTKYFVDTISLIDLLDKHNAPRKIDYLSIDTEGSEFEILSNFDFEKYSINIITCEHNYTDQREKIFDLLTSKGYQRKYTDLSRYDDWYVRVN
jgi:FkbM family methyltransferase